MILLDKKSIVYNLGMLKHLAICNFNDVIKIRFLGTEVFREGWHLEIQIFLAP